MVLDCLSSDADQEGKFRDIIVSGKSQCSAQGQHHTGKEVPGTHCQDSVDIPNLVGNVQVCLGTDLDVFVGMQVADAAELGVAEGAEELRALAQNGGMRRSSTASAVYDCRYRPYTAKQVASLTHRTTQTCTGCI